MQFCFAGENQQMALLLLFHKARLKQNCVVFVLLLSNCGGATQKGRRAAFLFPQVTVTTATVPLSSTNEDEDPLVSLSR